MNKEDNELSFGRFLYLQDIDLSGMIGYTVSKGKFSYYILQKDDAGEYERKQITKQQYETIQKVKHAKT